MSVFMRYLAVHEQQEMTEAIDMEQVRTPEKETSGLASACMCDLQICGEQEIAAAIDLKHILKH